MTHKISLLGRAIKRDTVNGVTGLRYPRHMATKHLIGMLHLSALPGAPNHRHELAEVESCLVEEACLLRDVGFHGAMMENFGDIPFHKGAVEVMTIACMTRLAMSVRRAVPELSLGINVLRNDARGALAVASATGARFIRVNVHVGATATDQGVIEGQAAATLRLKKELGSDVAIWADVHVKHGRSLAHASITDEAEDAVKRGLADALIVSGRGTGEATSLDDLRAVRDLELGAPVYVGSGVTAENIAALLDLADGVIVGTSLKADGRTTNAIDRERAERFIERAGD